MKDRFVNQPGASRKRWLVGSALALLAGILLPLSALLGLVNMPSEWLPIGEVLLFAGLSAYWLRRGWALVVVPLLVLVGYSVGISVIPLPIGRFSTMELRALAALIPVAKNALLAAVLGLLVAKGAQAVQRSQSCAPASAKASPPVPSSPPTVATEPAQPERAEPEPDEIATILDEMQRAYASAQQHGPQNGKGR